MSAKAQSSPDRGNAGEAEIILVAALTENGVIGRDGAMPWRLSSDLQHFKRVTLGHPVIMGRKTFESIGRPLPGRTNIVISRSGRTIDGVTVVDSLPAALQQARQALEESDGPEICIIGGGEIFAQAMDIAARLEITHIAAELDGDTFFPAIDPAEWALVSERHQPEGPRDSHAMRFAVYRRR
ncbi:dihydrofolate reductase [Pseudohoeflea coraliihabitans]|uniref:Dihydrofolate reductase n=1 Tax=Pseudohoeflea coraliihabitans TaxID=2860393 RepID=A0ABS6WJE4_9HYPH|nr:dihydrofolate reductase [Pseudohoeflea sp. DP4N28-3]MBW3095885.1 dihydrofolate reductase [Pseudohoeflea sp. DP4N28-3]